MTKQRKKTIYAQVGEDVYAAFLEAANRAGLGLKEFAGMMIEQGLLSSESVSSARRAVLRMRREQEEREDALRTIGKEYRRAMASGDADKVEELLKLAKEFNISQEEVEAVASVGTSAKPVTTEVERAAVWLAQYMSKRKIAPVKEVWAEADKEGISRWAVKAAASQLPTVKSVKTGTHWSLVMEKS